MKLDLSCPVELRGYALRRSGNETSATARMFNLTAHRIDVIDAVLKWRCSDTGRSLAMPITVDRLRAVGGSTFSLTFTNDRLPDADDVEILISSVRFDDGTDPWRSGNGLIVPLEPLPSISAEELTALRAAAGEDAVCYPEQQELTWRCVCGRPNPADAECCARCRRNRADALRCTPGYVQNAAQAGASAALAQEDLNRLRTRFHRQRRSLFRRTMVTALALLALTSLFLQQTQTAKAPAASTAMLIENK